MYISIGKDIEIDREQRRVNICGEQVRLTALEFGLLDYLCSHPNRICTREEILDNVWGARFHYDPGTIDVHLNALRRKMHWSSKRPIETVRGVGFIFRVERATTRYTLDLQSFIAQWLASRQVDIKAAGLVARMQLTPFVNEITIEPEALRRMLDGILAALLPAGGPGVLRLTSRLTMQHFILSMDINATVSELRIPICGDFETS
jgi:DNA-binding winged helix-turn-helix (wHTH) protein